MPLVTAVPVSLIVAQLLAFEGVTPALSVVEAKSIVLCTGAGAGSCAPV